MTVSLLPSQHGTEPAPARTAKTKPCLTETAYVAAVARMADLTPRICRTRSGEAWLDRVEALSRGKR